jgi:hypothetical protein
MPAQQGVATDIWHPSLVIGPGRVVTYTIHVMPMYSMDPLRSKQMVVGFFASSRWSSEWNKQQSN